MFGNNGGSYISGVRAIAQAIRTKVLLFYGEWWENIGVGIPMFQSIVGQMNSDAVRTSATLLITKRVQEVPGVLSVDDVAIELLDRAMLFKCRVQTEEGETEIEVVV